VIQYWLRPIFLKIKLKKMKTSSQRQPLSWLTSLTGKTLMVASLAVVTLFACKKTSDDATDSSALSKKAPTSENTSCAAAYPTTLVGGAGVYNQEDGNTTFIWEVYNINPGNGKGNNGTYQNLSHFSIHVTECAQNLWADIVSVSYKVEGAEGFTPLPGVLYKPDPTICTLDDVLKFDVGTTGTLKTYYKLVLDGNWTTETNTAYYKSGNNTGCCTAQIAGVGCREDSDDCSYSQGYWFSKPNLNWPGNLQIGEHTYTQEEGKAIFNSSNSGGMTDSKKAFTQLAAIRLSAALGLLDEDNLEIAGAIADIECFLNNLPNKLSPAYLPNQTGTCGTVKAKNAAETLSDWINANHCDQ
jgi:hypothetical protein